MRGWRLSQTHAAHKIPECIQSLLGVVTSRSWWFTRTHLDTARSQQWSRDKCLAWILTHQADEHTVSGEKKTVFTHGLKKRLGACTT